MFPALQSKSESTPECSPKSSSQHKKRRSEKPNHRLVDSTSVGLSRAPPSLSGFMVQKPTSVSPGSSPATTGSAALSPSPLAVALATSTQSLFSTSSKFPASNLSNSLKFSAATTTTTSSQSSRHTTQSFTQAGVSAPPTLSRTHAAAMSAPLPVVPVSSPPSSHVSTPERPHPFMRGSSSEGPSGE